MSTDNIRFRGKKRKLFIKTVLLSRAMYGKIYSMYNMERNKQKKKGLVIRDIATFMQS